MRLLILGGTTEASALARLLAGDARFAATLSLAGVTRHPLPQPVPVRVGGFGGVEGLARYLAEARIERLVDATHPFAARMSRHAVEAAAQAGIPLLRIERPAWWPERGDLWTEVPDMAAAAAVLGLMPRRVLLTVGQKELAPFAAAPWHRYTLRSVDPPDPASLPPGTEVLTATGPFTREGEEALLAARGIEVVVSKNSGGSAVAAKLEAARALGVTVVMVARPPLPPAETVPDAAAARRWLLAPHPALRGV
ncbi:cobalt-precorrin-6A reductase [Roseomonas sp. OT10]|uniref:cobalt-precorrin-6A reductase n=1 Tax=Roseomonas cutis TaxID=2897332 RepID=UPI001E48395C|nr:cobalt-precorrin-6A reductase [Roseomonas sp. OT10]UFN47808.1 cobalt-precorrin-6A reductase [Roseomonas sp. OT10]